jgi:hypothetical protein
LYVRKFLYWSWWFFSVPVNLQFNLYFIKKIQKYLELNKIKIPLIKRLCLIKKILDSFKWKNTIKVYQSAATINNFKNWSRSSINLLWRQLMIIEIYDCSYLRFKLWWFFWRKVMRKISSFNSKHMLKRRNGNKYLILYKCIWMSFTIVASIKIFYLNLRWMCSVHARR